MKTRRSISKEETIVKLEVSETPGKRKSLSQVRRTPISSRKGSSLKSSDNDILEECKSSPQVGNSSAITKEESAKSEDCETPGKRKVRRTPISSKKESSLNSSVDDILGHCKSSTKVGNSSIISKEEKSLGVEILGECKSLSNVYSSPIVRILRSRVVTSDNEDEVKATRTPRKRLSRGSLKEDKPLLIENVQVSPNAEENKTRKSPTSSKKRFSFQKLFDIVEMEENEDTDVAMKNNVRLKEDQDEPTTSVMDETVKQESETSDSQSLVQMKVEDREIGRDGSLVKEESEYTCNDGRQVTPVKKVQKSNSESKVGTLKKNDSESSDNEIIEDMSAEKECGSSDEEEKNSTFTKEQTITGNQKSKSEAVNSPRIPHVSPRRISFGFLETPIEDVAEDVSSSDSSTKISGETREVEEDGYQSEDEESSNSKGTEDISIDLDREQIRKAMDVSEKIVKKEEPDDFVKDGASSDVKNIKNAVKIEVAVVEDDDGGNDSDDEMSATVSQDSSEGHINRAMIMTAKVIQKEKEKRRKSLQTPEKKSFETIPEESSSEESKEESQTEEVAKQMDDESDSDEDMPEAISFDSGRDQINKAVSMAADAIRREKERRKEQQRKRMEMIKTQKEEKERKRMQRLKGLEMNLPKRLSEDLVSRLPDTPAIPTIRSADPKKKKKEKRETKEVEMSESKKKKITKFDDYIPLSNVKAATKFGVVPLEVMEKIPTSASEKAIEFKRQALFGSRINREPSKNLLSYKEKIGASFKNRQMNQKQRFKPYW